MTDTNLPDSLDDIAPREDGQKPVVSSLRELIDIVTGRNAVDTSAEGDAGYSEKLPFPFVALVGQLEMKLALLMALVNPHVGGVLLIGPRGTGKTTAVRGLLDLLPEVVRSNCYYGCLPEDIEAGGLDAVCPDCARKYGQGLPLSSTDRVRLVELPLNARLEDVVGSLDERAMIHERLRLRRGILAQADKNILYVDEVNLLADDIVDAILDASAQGSYTVRRGPHSASYHSRFALIGSMNPEEGKLRPQIMDRFGLRVLVKGLVDNDDRLEAYTRVRAYLESPRRTVIRYQRDTEQTRCEIEYARNKVASIHIDDRIARAGIDLIQQLGIHSLRAEITLFEAARAYAALDNRGLVNYEDICAVAPLALRMRRSEYINQYLIGQANEDEEIQKYLNHETPG